MTNHRDGGPFRRAIRRVAGPLRDELAESWRVALRLLALAAIGLAVVAPLLSLRSDGSPTGSVLTLRPVAGIGPVVTWTREAFGPTATQAAALAELFPVLAATAWATLGIAVIPRLPTPTAIVPPAGTRSRSFDSRMSRRTKDRRHCSTVS